MKKCHRRLYRGRPDGGHVLRRDAGFAVRADACHHLDQEDALALRREAWLISTGIRNVRPWLTRLVMVIVGRTLSTGNDEHRRCAR
jgi:hypothetical protein